MLVAVAALMCCVPAAQARRALYAVNPSGDQIVGFGVASDGGISWLPGFPLTNQQSPTAFVSAGDAAIVYAAGPAGVQAYTVNGDGLLSAAGAKTPAGAAPSAAAISASGTRLFVTNAGSSSVSRFAIAADGSLSALSGGATTTGAGPDGIAVTPDGTHVYVANGSDGTISILDGQASAVQGTPVPAGAGVSGLTLSADGKRLYAANTGDDTVSGWTIGSDGSLTELAGSPYPAGDGPRGIAISPDGSRLLTANSLGSTASRFLVDGSGTLGTAASTSVVAGASAVAISPDGTHAFFAGTASAAAYDLSSSGALTARGPAVVTTGPMNNLLLTPDQGPQAKMNAVAGAAGSPSTFDGGPSLDSDGTVGTWSWDFGDGATAEGRNVTHVYAQPGTYSVRLTVTDNEGCSTVATYTGQALACAGTPYATVTQPLIVGASPFVPTPDLPCVHDGNDGFCGTPDQKAPAVSVLGVTDGSSITTLDAPSEIVGTITPDPSGIKSVLLRFTKAAGTLRLKKTAYKKVCKRAHGKRKCKRKKYLKVTKTKVPACLTVSGTKNYLVKYVCSKVNYVSIGGDSTFRYSLPVALGVGSYSVDVIAVDGSGNSDTLEAGRNHVTFKVVNTPSNASSGDDTGTTTPTTTSTPITDTGSPFGRQ
jgi:YVTN family beta-propeller protein